MKNHERLSEDKSVNFELADKTRKADWLLDCDFHFLLLLTSLIQWVVVGNTSLWNQF